jgi:hypothetical protein
LLRQGWHRNKNGGHKNRHFEYSLTEKMRHG